MPITDDQSVREILGLSPVAVVGCSRSPEKAAHSVPAYLLEHGIDIIPVNPHAEEIFGRRAYPSLEAIDREVSVVTVFRPSEEVPGIVDVAIRRDDVVAIWLQRGINHPDALERAENEGIVVVADRCMRTEHRRLIM